MESFVVFFFNGNKKSPEWNSLEAHFSEDTFHSFTQQTFKSPLFLKGPSLLSGTTATLGVQSTERCPLKPPGTYTQWRKKMSLRFLPTVRFQHSDDLVKYLH